MPGRPLLASLRRAERFLRHRTTRVAALATRFNRIAFYAMDLVLWSRIFRSRKGPLPPEVPLWLLKKKNIGHSAPILHVSGMHPEVAHWDDGFAGVYTSLFENLQMPDALSHVRYAHPAPAFRGVYLWDSAFISQIWQSWDKQVAHDVSMAVVHLRDGKRLQHVVSDFVASAYTQPPLIAWSLARTWQGAARDEAAAHLGPAFEPLADYNAWLYANRRLENGLFFWLHPYESGVENSPRFSNRDESRLEDTSRLAAPDLNSYVVLQNEALAEMAHLLGRDASRFESQARELQERMRTQLWHDEDGLFYDRHADTGEFIRCRTIASLLPLWAGAADPRQAQRLLEHVLAPHAFNTPLPLPSVALNDPGFSLDMWRGPVWINTAFGVLQGLKRYGYEREASALVYRICDTVYRIFRRERRFYEFYDPVQLGLDRLHRKRGNRWKAFTLGQKPQTNFVGWTGLVNTLVLEQLAGFHRRSGRLYVQPRFPEAALGKGYSFLFPSRNLAVDFTVFSREQVRVTTRTPSGISEDTVAFGEELAIGSPVSGAPLPV